MTRDYYRALGIEKNATPDDIKKAYKKLARQYHPDMEGGDEEKFKEVGEAYDILKDEEKRSNYDRFGDPAGRPGFSSGDPFGGSGFGRRAGPVHGDSDINDLLKKMHAYRSARAGQDDGWDDIFTIRTSRDINVDYEITLEEAFTGKRVNAIVNVPNRGKKELPLTIPAGIEHSNRIRFAGEGIQNHPRAVPGDIYITIKIKPEPRFRRQGQTLFTSASVNAIDAMLGDRIQIKGIDGKMLSLNIPAGTQNGDQLRCRGHGFSIQGMINRGDLIVEITVTIPKSLRPEEEALLRQLKNIRENRQ